MGQALLCWRTLGGHAVVGNIRFGNTAVVDDSVVGNSDERDASNGLGVSVDGDSDGALVLRGTNDDGNFGPGVACVFDGDGDGVVRWRIAVGGEEFAGINGGDAELGESAI